MVRSDQLLFPVRGGYSSEGTSNRAEAFTAASCPAATAATDSASVASPRTTVTAADVPSPTYFPATAHDENPRRVEYALTGLGRSLLGPMDVACAWAREHLDELPRTDERRRPVWEARRDVPAPEPGAGRAMSTLVDRDTG
ncbi:winged helix-turn-helix transcriptional regulator [Kitasatospora sp. NPDC101235]|uniref:winged helix-turn-helix transcriptional regulator n=1 Tax=Kitasatospora sp. NPDC101235 TaxID=3364101 RepID=UPI00382F2CB2